MFDAGLSLSSLLVPLSGQASHMAPIVLGATDTGVASLADRALPTCRALDLWAAGAGRSAERSDVRPLETSFASRLGFA